MTNVEDRINANVDLSGNGCFLVMAAGDKTLHMERLSDGNYPLSFFSTLYAILKNTLSLVVEWHRRESKDGGGLAYMLMDIIITIICFFFLSYFVFRTLTLRIYYYGQPCSLGWVGTLSRCVWRILPARCRPFPSH